MRWIPLAFFAAACSADDGRTTGFAEASGPPTTTASTTMSSDSIATAWETTDTESSSSSSGRDDTTATSTAVDDTSTSSDEGDTSSSTGTPPPPVNLFANPDLEIWTNADEPNTTPDAWENCTIGGLAVEAVPDTCNGMPDPIDGARYARALVGEGIEQTVETVPGTMYRITFDYTAVTNCFGGGSSARWEVLVDEDQILVTENPPLGWQLGEATFAATQPTTTICFRKFADGEGGIDNLSVLEDQ